MFKLEGTSIFPHNNSLKGGLIKQEPCGNRIAPVIEIWTVDASPNSATAKEFKVHSNLKMTIIAAILLFLPSVE